MDFNIQAAVWDTERRKERSKIIAAEIQRSIGTKRYCTALEFGCGTGLVSFSLKDRFKHITLIDTSKGMIDVLNQKIGNSRASNMTALHADINDERLSAGTFDVIYSSMVLHHVIEIKEALKRLFELLHNDGYLCIVDLVEEGGSFHKNEKDFSGHNGFNPNELKRTFEKLGFREIEGRIFYNGEKDIGDEKVIYSLFIIVGRK